MPMSLQPFLSLVTSIYIHEKRRRDGFSLLGFYFVFSQLCAVCHLSPHHRSSSLIKFFSSINVASPETRKHAMFETTSYSWHDGHTDGCPGIGGVLRPYKGGRPGLPPSSAKFLQEFYLAKTIKEDSRQKPVHAFFIHG